MASFGTPRFQIFRAEGDLSSDQWKFMKIGTADDKVVRAGDNENAIGILINAPTNDQPAEIAMLGGGANLKVAGSVSRGDFLESDTNGLGETSSGTGNHKVRAVALVAGVANDVISVERVFMSHDIP